MGSDKLFQKKKSRKEKEFARNKAKKSPYETILIVCEDSKSGHSYFKKLIQHFRLNAANVRVVPSKGSAPISVVDYAIEIARKETDIDRIACVFDQDNHESYERAKRKLEEYKPKRNDKSKPKYMSITSNPCFEIWLLLHLKYTTKPYNSSGNKSPADHVIRDLCEMLPSYSKSSADWFNDLNTKLTDAIINAKRLEGHNNNTSSKNPSTNIHGLVEYLINLNKLRLG